MPLAGAFVRLLPLDLGADALAGQHQGLGLVAQAALDLRAADGNAADLVGQPLRQPRAGTVADVGALHDGVAGALEQVAGGVGIDAQQAGGLADGVIDQFAVALVLDCLAPAHVLDQFVIGPGQRAGRDAGAAGLRQSQQPFAVHLAAANLPVDADDDVIRLGRDQLDQLLAGQLAGLHLADDVFAGLGVHAVRVEFLRRSYSSLATSSSFFSRAHSAWAINSSRASTFCS